MKSDSCIIVLTHPNTEDKINLLERCLDVLSLSGIPIYVFSNMEMDKKHLSKAEEFVLAGDNKLYSPSDFLPPEKIVEARHKTKYRSHLFLDDYTITFIPINYGANKSYYWACINLYKVALSYVNSLGYSKFMLSQYDTILPEEDISLVGQNLDDLQINSLDGEFSVDPEMGDSHLSGDVFFGRVEWWEKLFGTMSPEDFYESTFPNWTPEEYFYKRAAEMVGKIKIRVRKNVSEGVSGYYKNLPSGWIKEEISSELSYPASLFFPNIKESWMSSHLESEDFDIEKSLTVSVYSPKNSDYYQLFVWNRKSNNHDREISLDIEIFDSHKKLVDKIKINLVPGAWSWRNFDLSIGGGKIIFTASSDMDLEITREYII